jgi:hypothetical protein
MLSFIMMVRPTRFSRSGTMPDAGTRATRL